METSTDIYERFAESYSGRGERERGKVSFKVNIRGKFFARNFYPFNFPLTPTRGSMRFLRLCAGSSRFNDGVITTFDEPEWSLKGREDGRKVDGTGFTWLGIQMESRSLLPFCPASINPILFSLSLRYPDLAYFVRIPEFRHNSSWCITRTCTVRSRTDATATKTAIF